MLLFTPLPKSGNAVKDNTLRDAQKRKKRRFAP